MCDAPKEILETKRNKKKCDFVRAGSVNGPRAREQEATYKKLVIEKRKTVRKQERAFHGNLKRIEKDYLALKRAKVQLQKNGAKKRIQPKKV